MHTTAVWWEAAPAALERAFATRQAALDGFLGAASAVHRIAALLSLAELHDLGRAVGDGGPESAWCAAAGGDGRAQAHGLDGATVDVGAAGTPFRPTLYLYDNFPGGIGLAAPLFDLRDRVLDQSIDLVESCPCRHGCPACVGPVLAADETAAITPKAAALRVLRLLRGDGTQERPS
jgi:DEAD/DEAH box helicase domain-containing protein